MPQTPNPHRMGAPLVYTFPITSTPTGAVQLTGLALDGISVLTVMIINTTAEVTGSSKGLDVGYPAHPSAYTKGEAGQLGTCPFNPQGFSTPPDPGDHLVYQAESNDWAEYRGTIKVIYAHSASL